MKNQTHNQTQTQATSERDRRLELDRRRAELAVVEAELRARGASDATVLDELMQHAWGLPPLYFELVQIDLMIANNNPELGGPLGRNALLVSLLRARQEALLTGREPAPADVAEALRFTLHAQQLAESRPVLSA